MPRCCLLNWCSKLLLNNRLSHHILDILGLVGFLLLVCKPELRICIVAPDIELLRNPFAHSLYHVSLFTFVAFTKIFCNCNDLDLVASLSLHILSLELSTKHLLNWLSVDVNLIACDSTIVGARLVPFNFKPFLSCPQASDGCHSVGPVNERL
jgi:hypothetical protein